MTTPCPLNLQETGRFHTGVHIAYTTVSSLLSHFVHATGETLCKAVVEVWPLDATIA